MGLSWVLPLSWELVEMARVVPSAPVAVMETEVAFVLCHVKVTAWPEVTLLLLAANVRVGVGFDEEPFEPELQPARAKSSETTATPNRALRRVMSGLLLLDKRNSNVRLLAAVTRPAFVFSSGIVQRIYNQENNPAEIKVKQHSHKGPWPTIKSLQVRRGLAKFLQLYLRLTS